MQHKPTHYTLLTYLLISSTFLFCIDNNITLQSYESNINAYVNGTPSVVSGVVKIWIDKTLSMIPDNAHIIEIGSAFGRDAHYIESHGFTVERTDATEGFVTLLQQQKYPAKILNILTDDFTQTYDLIFANAVFLHFTPAEFTSILNKIYNSLSPQGILSFSMKYGYGEEWSTEKLGSKRYFHYWQLNDLKDFISAAHLETLSIFQDQRFLYLIAKKSW